MCAREEKKGSKHHNRQDKVEGRNKDHNGELSKKKEREKKMGERETTRGGRGRDRGKETERENGMPGIRQRRNKLGEGGGSIRAPENANQN